MSEKISKVLFPALLLCVGLLASGCLYTHVRTPMGVVTRDTKIIEKEGVSQSQSILWLFAWGDSGVQAAAKEGKLKTISYADSEILNIFFGAYLTKKTVVYGE